VVTAFDSGPYDGLVTAFDSGPYDGLVTAFDSYDGPGDSF
jgi:hypothetical protein